MKVFVFALLLAAANAVVVFESFQDTGCLTPMWTARPLYLPLTDRIQGIDSQVSAVIYSGNPPGSVGGFSVINSTVATLRAPGGATQSWTVWPTRNTNVCELVPGLGYGRFYVHSAAVVMQLARTTGQMSTFDQKTCDTPQNYQWVAYADTNLADSSAPCPTAAGAVQWFWDNGDKLVYYVHGQNSWTSPQPCGAGPYPGEKCFSAGLGYCTKNANCAIDHTSSPVTFPFGGAAATTVKVTTVNYVDQSSGTGTPGAAALLAPSVALLVAAFALLH